MTAEQVAEYLQISLQTVYNKTSSGELKSVVVGGLKRYRKSDL
ncbi:MAG: helix-turn-helix domain-containing protein [Candidatus Marinimicrobia bacterium]|nr:helix-turn-helix domain-containing protein [Candidatus Neomarinimicrobiota bacterium]